MLKYHNYKIVFQEIPDEITLAINLTNCPNRCKSCHSPHLQQDTGLPLDKTALASLLETYGDAITCVCFMGGDAQPAEVEHLARSVKELTGGRTKSAWYSGRSTVPDNCSWLNFDYIKLGAYIEQLGGLDSPNTNQRLYKIENGKKIDITHKFHKPDF